MANLDLSSPLDITSWRQTGQELQDKIFREIKGMSESLIIPTLPSKILMTQSQYDDLLKLGRMPEAYQFESMFHDEERLFVTPYNVMEVRVDKGRKLTFKEVQTLDDKSFDKWEKSVEKQND